MKAVIPKLFSFGIKTPVLDHQTFCLGNRAERVATGNRTALTAQ